MNKECHLQVLHPHRRDRACRWLIRLGLAGALVLLSATVLAAPPHKLTETMLRQGFNIPAKAKITYLDANGKPMTFAQFAARMPHTFSKDMDVVSGDTTLRLDPDKKPGVMKSTQFTEGLAPGHAFPDFHLKTVSGQSVDQKTLRGKPTLISFYFAECVPCIAELPALNAFARKHPDIRVLAFTPDSKKTTMEFRRKRHFKWPVAYAAQDLILAARVKTYPEMVLVDDQGRIVRMGHSPNSGSTTEGDIERWISNTSQHQVKGRGHSPR
jgi:peroxiredoxin